MFARPSRRLHGIPAILALFIAVGFLLSRLGLAPEDEEDGEATRTPAQQARINSLRFSLSNYQPRFLLKAATESICQNSSDLTDLTLIYVHSQPDHFDERQFIRNSWFAPHFKALYNFRVVFVLGNPLNWTLQKEVIAENGLHQDIVQEDFRDVYQNLTLKEAAALRWTAKYCLSARFVVKVDDDVVVKPWYLAEILQRKKSKTQEKKPQLICQVFEGAKPRRNPNSKWYAPKEVYAASSYPSYCSGPIRIMAASAVSLLLKGTETVPFLWLEDVYFSGLVAEAMGVERVNEWNLVEEHSWNRWFFPRFASPYSWSTALHAYNLKNMRLVWEDIVQTNNGHFAGRGRI